MSCCSICCEEITSDVAVLKCTHLFHGECISKWFYTGAERCPLCRHSVIFDEPPFTVLESLPVTAVINKKKRRRSSSSSTTVPVPVPVQIQYDSDCDTVTDDEMPPFYSSSSTSQAQRVDAFMEDLIENELTNGYERIQTLDRLIESATQLRNEFKRRITVDLSDIN